MALLRILGVPDRAAQLTAEAVLRAADQRAVIKSDWITGVVEVTGVVRADVLCDVLRQAGFDAASLTHRSGAIGGRDFFWLLLRALGFGLGGWAVGAVLGAGLGILNVLMNPSCKLASDEGVCAMGIVMIALGMAVIGMIAAAGMTLIRGALRLSHARRTGRDLPFG